jgi:hypothetical protein
MLKIERTYGENKMWKPAADFPMGTMLSQKESGTLFLRIDSAIVRLAEDDYELIPLSRSGSLYREVAATLTVEL